MNDKASCVRESVVAKDAALDVLESGRENGGRMSQTPCPKWKDQSADVFSPM